MDDFAAGGDHDRVLPRGANAVAFDRLHRALAKLQHKNVAIDGPPCLGEVDDPPQGMAARLIAIPGLAPPDHQLADAGVEHLVLIPRTKMERRDVVEVLANRPGGDLEIPLHVPRRGHQRRALGGPQLGIFAPLHQGRRPASIG